MLVMGDFNAHLGSSGGPQGCGDMNPQGCFMSSFLVSLSDVAHGLSHIYLLLKCGKNHSRLLSPGQQFSLPD